MYLKTLKKLASKKTVAMGYTTKYPCTHCRKQEMLPNIVESRCMGFVCLSCGQVNYPHKKEPRGKLIIA